MLPDNVEIVMIDGPYGGKVEGLRLKPQPPRQYNRPTPEQGAANRALADFIINDLFAAANRNKMPKPEVFHAIPAPLASALCEAKASRRITKEETKGLIDVFCAIRKEEPEGGE